MVIINIPSLNKLIFLRASATKNPRKTFWPNLNCEIIQVKLEVCRKSKFFASFIIWFCLKLYLFEFKVCFTSEYRQRFPISKVSKLIRCETIAASDGKLFLGLSKITISTRTDSFSSCSLSARDNIYFSFLFTQKTFWNPQHPSCNLLTYFNGELKSFVSFLFTNIVALLLNKSTFFALGEGGESKKVTSLLFSPEHSKTYHKSYQNLRKRFCLLWNT